MLVGRPAFSLLVAALLGGLAAPARAQVPPAPQPADDAAAPSPTEPPTVAAPPATADDEASAGPALPRGSFGFLVDLVPAGSVSTGVGASFRSFDAATTYGVSAGLDYFVSPKVAIGAVPRFVWGIHGADPMSSATQLDLLVRASVGTPAGEGLSVRAYGNVGMSWIFFTGDTASGVTFGIGAAASYAIGDSNFVSLDIGYQLGRQTVNVGEVKVDASSDLVHLGLGLGSYF